jgi:hypothetical protein
VGTLDDVGGYTRNLFVDGGRLYVTDLIGGLVVYDLTTPGDPQLLWRIAHGVGVEGLTVEGDLAYVTNRFALTIASLTDERTVGQAAVLDYSEVLTVHNGVAYCEGNDFASDWLDILDVSDPTAPTGITRYVFPGPRVFAERLRGVGDTLYVTRATAGLETYDVADPGNIQLLDAYLTGGTALGLALRNDLAFVGDTTNGLVVLDVQDPTDIQLVAQRPEANTGWLALCGDVAYTTDATPRCIRVWDIADPSSPTEITSVTTPDAAGYGILVHGDRLYLAQTSAGLLVYDISDPAAPVLETTLFAGGEIWAVASWGGSVVVGDRNAGLYVIDPGVAF